MQVVLQDLRFAFRQIFRNPGFSLTAVLSLTLGIGAAVAKRTALTPEEAKASAIRALRFKKERGRGPFPTAQDPWERKMAEGTAAFLRFDKEGRYA